MNRTAFILFSIIFLGFSCKTSTDPKPADCESGYHPCENDNTICCPDTTSHFVSWTYDTLGAVNTWSEINDVAIIDEDNIWAVGNIYLIDENQNWIQYNAVKWNGSSWEYISIAPPPSGYHGQIYRIYVFNENDVWLTMDSLPVHYDGHEYYLYTPAVDDYPGGFIISDIWGTSSSNMYFIGGSGKIIHFDGEVFTEMDSGTDIYINSISGTDETNICVSGYSDSQCRSVLLHYDGSAWETRYEIEDCSIFNPDSLSGLIRCLKAFEEELIVVTSKGIYRCDNSTRGDCQLLQEGIDSRKYDIEGTELNDFFIAGEFQSILHYNGNSFRQFDEIPTSGRLYGIDKYNQTIIGGGYNRITHQALLIKGIQ